MLDGSTGPRIRCLTSLKLNPHLRNIHYLFSPTLPAWAGGLFHWRRPPTSLLSQFLAQHAAHYSSKQHRHPLNEGASKEGWRNMLCSFTSLKGRQCYDQKTTKPSDVQPRHSIFKSDGGYEKWQQNKYHQNQKPGATCPNLGQQLFPFLMDRRRCWDREN